MLDVESFDQHCQTVAVSAINAMHREQADDTCRRFHDVTSDLVSTSPYFVYEANKSALRHSKVDPPVVDADCCSIDATRSISHRHLAIVVLNLHVFLVYLVNTSHKHVCCGA